MLLEVFQDKKQYFSALRSQYFQSFYHEVKTKVLYKKDLDFTLFEVLENLKSMKYLEKEFFDKNFLIFLVLEFKNFVLQEKNLSCYSQSVAQKVISRYAILHLIV
jgi:hypothetical protein